jgi:aminomethyltransferase
MLGLEIGQVRYAPFCDENGKMVGDGTVFKIDDSNCIVVTALDTDLDHFNGVVGGLDVEITAMTTSTPQVGINGPRSRELLQSICEADVSSLGYFRFWPEQVEVGGVPCWVSRTGYSGELGFELFCSPDGADQLWAAVVGAGARPYGLSAVETIRIESGLIFIGYDYFQHETSPYDMSLDKMIRLDGPDFCGKAALAAEAADPPRRLVTLVLDGDDVPEYGAAVTKDGEPAGTLTSPCESPTLGQVIGMAVLETPLAAVGTRVEVALGDGTVAATVAPLPLYDTEKTRPRA